MVVSAGLNRRGRQPQLPTSCLPAHSAASPSPTHTKFPTCLSVSDSSSKYLAARAPAVLSPLRLLPCLPQGGSADAARDGRGPEPRSLVGSGGLKAGGTSLNSEVSILPLPGLGDREPWEATRASPGWEAAANAPTAPRNLPGGPSGGLLLASADETASATPATAAQDRAGQGGGAQEAPGEGFAIWTMALSLMAALVPHHRPSLRAGGTGDAFQPSCSMRGTPAQLPGLACLHLDCLGGLICPQLPYFLLALPPSQETSGGNTS